MVAAGLMASAAYAKTTVVIDAGGGRGHSDSRDYRGDKNYHRYGGYEYRNNQRLHRDVRYREVDSRSFGHRHSRYGKIPRARHGQRYVRVNSDLLLIGPDRLVIRIYDNWF